MFCGRIEIEQKQTNLSCAAKCIIVVSHLFLFVVLLADPNGTVYTRNTFRNTTFASKD